MNILIGLVYITLVILSLLLGWVLYIILLDWMDDIKPVYIPPGCELLEDGKYRRLIKPEAVVDQAGREDSYPQPS